MWHDLSDVENDRNPDTIKETIRRIHVAWTMSSDDEKDVRNWAYSLLQLPEDARISDVQQVCVAKRCPPNKALHPCTEHIVCETLLTGSKIGDSSVKHRA